MATLATTVPTAATATAAPAALETREAPPTEFRVPPPVQSWYLVGRARDVRSGAVVSRDVLSAPIVLFRTQSGALAALSAHCWHMGAHLGNGSVAGERLRCPLHHWEYDAAGACRRVPGSDEPPAGAHQVAYPVAERFGGVFVFNGPAPLFPLPSFSAPDDRDLQVSHGRPVYVRCPWYAVAANAFDRQHLQTVHARALREPPVVERPDAYRIRLRYVSRVVGHGAADEMMRRLSGDRIRVAVTCWGGNVLTVESDLGRARGALLLSLLPVAGGTEITPIFVVHRAGPGAVGAALRAARLAVSRWLFSRFLERDVGLLDGMRFRPRLPLPADEPMASYLAFLQGLPPAQSGSRSDR